VIDVATLNVIRRWALRDQMSIREISRRTGLAPNTVKKYLRSDETEPNYERRVSSSKLDPYAEKLSTWLGIEATKSRKQRRTLRQIHTKIVNETLKQDILELKKSGFQKISVTSGARTPWRQADLYANAKKNGNPVGKYVRSDHMFGQAGDMSIPSGWGWNSASHEKLRSVMGRLGLEMRVPNDPVHFTLAAPSHSFYARRLAMVRAYMAKASQMKAAQGAVYENAIFDQSRIVEQKTKVEADLRARNAELTKKTDLFARISAVYLSKQRELQQLDAEISRRDDEARRRAEREARRDRDEQRSRRDFNRPEPNPPKMDRPEPPYREPPRKDPPSRERPGNEGGTIRMPRLG
jgi:hypothetical protein